MSGYWEEEQRRRRQQQQQQQGTAPTRGRGRGATPPRVTDRPTYPSYAQPQGQYTLPTQILEPIQASRDVQMRNAAAREAETIREHNLRLDEANTTARSNPYHMNSLLSSLPPENTLTATAGPPRSGHAPSPSAGNRHQASTQTQSKMSISAILGGESPAKAKSDKSRSSEPKKDKTISPRRGEEPQASGRGDSSRSGAQRDKGKEVSTTRREESQANDGDVNSRFGENSRSGLTWSQSFNAVAEDPRHGGGSSQPSTRPTQRTESSAIRGKESQTSGRGGNSKASARSDKGKKKQIDNNPPLEPQGKGRDRSPPSNEPPSKRAAVEPKRNLKPILPSTSSSREGIRRDYLHPAFTEDKFLEMCAIKWLTNLHITDGDVANRLGVGFTADNVRRQLNTMPKMYSEPTRRGWTTDDEETCMRMTKEGESSMVIARTLHRTMEDVEEKLRTLSLTYDLSPVKSKRRRRKRT